MYSVLALGQDTTRRQINPACNLCRSLKARCSNAIRTASVADVNTYKPCVRCVRRGVVCTYSGSRPATLNSWQSTNEPQRQYCSEPGLSQDIQPAPNGTSPAACASLMLPPPSELDLPTLTGSDELLEADWDSGVHLQMFTDSARDTQGMDIPRAPQSEIPDEVQGDDPHQQPFQNHFGETYVEDHVPLDIPQPQLTFDLHTTPAQSTRNFPSFMIQEEASPNHQEQEVGRFFEDLYTMYPVLDKDIVSKRLSTGDAIVDAQFQTLVLALLMVNSASDHRKNPSLTTEAALQTRIEAVEQCRSKYDFAELPTVDTVIVSFFLFCAYNTLWRQNRAFLYLRETCDLFCVVSETVGDTSNISLRRRLARLELIIFNAELATYAIYGPARAHGQRPRSIPRGAAILQQDPTEDPSERQLDNLLLQLSQIHASSANNARNFGMGLTQFLRQMTDEHESPAMNLELLAGEFMPIEADDPRGIRRLTADVIITHHWRSLEKISQALDQRTGPFIFSSSKEVEARMAIRKVICNKTSAALAAACSLSEGELRIVGLGKLALAAASFRKIRLRCGDAGLNECENVLAGLLFTIVKADYERALAGTIQECFSLVLGNRSFPSPRNCLSPPRPTPSGFDEFGWDDMIENYDDPEFHLEVLVPSCPPGE